MEIASIRVLTRRALKATGALEAEGVLSASVAGTGASRSELQATTATPVVEAMTLFWGTNSSASNSEKQ